MRNNCDQCQKTIEQNEPHHTINFHRERLNGNICFVDFEETILSTCISCGKNVHRDAVVRVLSTPNANKAKLLGDVADTHGSKLGGCAIDRYLCLSVFNRQHQFTDIDTLFA